MNDITELLKEIIKKLQPSSSYGYKEWRVSNNDDGVILQIIGRDDNLIVKVEIISSREVRELGEALIKAANSLEEIEGNGKQRPLSEI